MSDEKHLTKTLTKESDNFTSKFNHISSSLHKSFDLEFSAWHEEKPSNPNTSFLMPSTQRISNQRASQNLPKYSNNLYTPISFSSSLPTQTSHKRTLSLSYNSPYKVLNKPLPSRFNIAFDDKPRLTRAKKHALVSIYFSPQKTRKPPKSHFAEVADLLQMLRPHNKSPVKKPITTTLRSKSDLNRSLSRKKINTKVFGTSASQYTD